MGPYDCSTSTAETGSEPFGSPRLSFSRWSYSASGLSCVPQPWPVIPTRGPTAWPGFPRDAPERECADWNELSAGTAHARSRHTVVVD